MPAPMMAMATPHPEAAVSSATPGPRYYAHLCPPFANEPTRDRVKVISTEDGKGEGLQAVAGFRAGEIVFTFTGSVVSEQTLYTLQLEPGKYLSDPLVMGKVLHSCAPNMHCDMRTLTFTAVRDIAPGEMLTMDYESTEDELFRQFYCGCGAANCRGWIRGRKLAR